MHVVCTSIEKPAYAGRYEWYTEYVPVWGGAGTTSHNQCAFCPGWQLFSSLRARALLYSVYRSWRGNAVVASFCRRVYSAVVSNTPAGTLQISARFTFFISSVKTWPLELEITLACIEQRNALLWILNRSPPFVGDERVPPWRGFLGLINFNIYTRTIFLSVTEIKEIFDDYFIFYN